MNKELDTPAIQLLIDVSTESWLRVNLSEFAATGGPRVGFSGSELRVCFLVLAAVMVARRALSRAPAAAGPDSSPTVQRYLRFTQPARRNTSDSLAYS